MKKMYITSRKWTIIVIAVCVGIVGTLCCFLVPETPGFLVRKSPENSSSVSILGEDIYVTVHISGCVLEPDQLITLPEGARVSDAVQAAGGATEEADLSALNLAAFLKDGQKITVPSKSDDNAERSLININTASLAELDSLPGIGPSLAQRIIDFRNEFGPFSATEELKAVNGIGEKLFAQLEEKIRV